VPVVITAGEKLVGDMKCASCHTPTFHGAGTVPRLAGQKQPYLAWQLEAFRAGGRSHPRRLFPLAGLERRDGCDEELRGLLVKEGREAVLWAFLVAQEAQLRLVFPGLRIGKCVKRNAAGDEKGSSARQASATAAEIPRRCGRAVAEVSHGACPHRPLRGSSAGLT
jgi:hypothetical protein